MATFLVNEKMKRKTCVTQHRVCSVPRILDGLFFQRLTRGRCIKRTCTKNSAIFDSSSVLLFAFLKAESVLYFLYACVCVCVLLELISDFLYAIRVWAWKPPREKVSKTKRQKVRKKNKTCIFSIHFPCPPPSPLYLFTLGILYFFFVWNVAPSQVHRCVHMWGLYAYKTSIVLAFALFPRSGHSTLFLHYPPTTSPVKGDFFCFVSRVLFVFPPPKKNMNNLRCIWIAIFPPPNVLFLRRLFPSLKMWKTNERTCSNDDTSTEYIITWTQYNPWGFCICMAVRFFFLSTLYLANKIEVTLHVNLFFWNHTHAQKKGAHDCNRIEEKNAGKYWNDEKKEQKQKSLSDDMFIGLFFFSRLNRPRNISLFLLFYFFSRTANGFFFVGLFLGSNWQEALQLCWRISPPL